MNSIYLFNVIGKYFFLNSKFHVVKSIKNGQFVVKIMDDILTHIFAHIWRWDHDNDLEYKIP